MKHNGENKKELDTYIYIDVSNIRNACRISCGFYLDFIKLYQYLKKRYPNLREVRYYEGVYQGDAKKLRWLQRLERVGYTICTLERKKYIQNAKVESFKCWRCGVSNNVEVLKEVIKYKSNVDVYLASDVLLKIAQSKKPLNIVILSCDGDYVELIRNIFKLRPDSYVTVLATPFKIKNNVLSYRLKKLSSELDRGRYQLNNIETIKDLIAFKVE